MYFKALDKFTFSIDPVNRGEEMLTKEYITCEPMSNARAQKQNL